MRTEVTRAEVLEFLRTLGADTSRTKHVTITPFKITVDQFRLDEDGYKVVDAGGFPVEVSTEIAITEVERDVIDVLT